MEFKDIKQWIVSADKLARPVNIYTNFHPVQHPGFPFDRSRQQWAEFDKEAQQHTYVTDLEPGIYDGDRVEVVWQLCKHGQWINYQDNISHARYLAKQIDPRTRKVLRLKQQLKEPEIKVLAESLCAHCGGNVDVVQIGESVIDITKQPLNPNANAIKVIQDRISELDETKSEMSHQIAIWVTKYIIDELNHILKLLQS